MIGTNLDDLEWPWTP